MLKKIMSLIVSDKDVTPDIENGIPTPESLKDPFDDVSLRPHPSSLTMNITSN